MQNKSPNVSPRRISFEVSFPLFPYRIKRGERRISLTANKIPPNPSRTYPNPLAVALRYKRLLDTPGIGSQAKLAKKVGVSPARISQMLRLLKLPQNIKQSVIQMGDPLPSREISERKLRALFVSSQQTQKSGPLPEPPLLPTGLSDAAPIGQGTSGHRHQAFST